MKPTGRFFNRLLSSLPKSEYERLRPSLKPVMIPAGQVLRQPGQPIRDVYFVQRGVVSQFIAMKTRGIDVDLVGPEGMLGLPLWYGNRSALTRWVAQTPTEALRMRAEVFRRAAAPGSHLYTVVRRYAAAVWLVTTRLAACNGSHSLKERCCRWLLMVADRAGEDRVQIGHQLLAQMLGVRRAGVTELLGSFQRSGLIQQRRGQITLLKRKTLEGMTCECYQASTRLLAGRT